MDQHEHADEQWEHHVIRVHVRQRRPDQVDRYRDLRSLATDDPIRPALVAHLTEEIEGIGVLDDVWTAELN